MKSTTRSRGHLRLVANEPATVTALPTATRDLDANTVRACANDLTGDEPFLLAQAGVIADAVTRHADGASLKAVIADACRAMFALGYSAAATQHEQTVGA